MSAAWSFMNGAFSELLSSHTDVRIVIRTTGKGEMRAIINFRLLVAFSTISRNISLYICCKTVCSLETSWSCNPRKKPICFRSWTSMCLERGFFISSTCLCHSLAKAFSMSTAMHIKLSIVIRIHKHALSCDIVIKIFYAPQRNIDNTAQTSSRSLSATWQVSELLQWRPKHLYVLPFESKRDVATGTALK